MAPRGPKTKPTKLKLLTGTARAHRLNPDEPEPEVARPDAPEHLTDAAREEWDRVTVELMAIGVLSQLDRGALAAYCQAYGRWSAAETALARMAARDTMTDSRTGAWGRSLLERKPARVATMAIANKTAHTAWALLAKGESFKATPAI